MLAMLLLHMLQKTGRSSLAPQCHQLVVTSGLGIVRRKTMTGIGDQSLQQWTWILLLLVIHLVALMNAQVNVRLRPHPIGDLHLLLIHAIAHGLLLTHTLVIPLVAIRRTLITTESGAMRSVLGILKTGTDAVSGIVTATEMVLPGIANTTGTGLLNVIHLQELHRPGKRVKSAIVEYPLADRLQTLSLRPTLLLPLDPMKDVL